MTGGRALLTVLALAGTLTLTACTNDPPPPPPTTSTSSTPVTPAATPPPEPAVERTAQGATAFVRYFWNLYNYAYASYDTAPIAERSDASCRFCASVVGQIQKLKESHTRVEGYKATVIESAVPPEKITTGTLVVSAIRQEAGTATGPDGKRNPLKGFRSVRSTVALAWDASGWHVEAVTNDPKTRVDW